MCFDTQPTTNDTTCHALKSIGSVECLVVVHSVRIQRECAVFAFRRNDVNQCKYIYEKQVASTGT